MHLLERFNQFVKQQNLFHQKDKLILAVSGGVDSVVLCELCKQAGYNFLIAHCNFRLRGKESERDKEFVIAVGDRYGVEVMVKDFDTEKYAQESKKGIQEAARDLRYEWFGEIVSRESSVVSRESSNVKSETSRVKHQKEDSSHVSRLTSHVLTAHHADDNIETITMNFFRGTGLHGLEGIPVMHQYIRRPLLPFWKEELIQFARENNLEFVEDSSNQSTKYTRNLFRNEIIPLVSKVYPQAKTNLLDNISRFHEIQKLYQTSVKEFKRKLCKVKNDEVHIPIKQLMSYHNRALIFEIISEYGFTEKQVDEVIKLAEAESGKFIQSPAAPHRIIKFRNWFIISMHQPEKSEIIIIDEKTKNVQFSSFNLQFSILQNSNLKPETSNLFACLDTNEIIYPLILRKWKQGDYFYPLGMKKKKKLARFFIDQKLSKTEREKTWVIEMNKKIVWVVGLRIDDRFRITEKTKTILKISLETS
ncbi:MAG TPA: tRNA lysidine(34) synthetase TilS [Chitinophagaceae bacterium]|jgi:tRNA(Ile)-lysidine synthase|nr:tRNA lysidine(34) synthetase TilS [Chitinophagaceae bacterium]